MLVDYNNRIVSKTCFLLILFEASAGMETKSVSGESISAAYTTVAQIKAHMLTKDMSTKMPVADSTMLSKTMEITCATSHSSLWHAPYMTYADVHKTVLL